MLITVLKSKISHATITHTELHYEGSITLDEDFMDAAGLYPDEQVQLVNVNNGERLITYVIKGKRGSKVVGLNGPAARRGEVGDVLHILAYAQIDPKIEKIDPKLVFLKDA